MSDNTNRFTHRVDDYVKYRPSYSSELIGFLKEKLNINNKTQIADIGSGTGISAKLFLELGATVFGVEPNLKMRTAANIYLKEYSNFLNIDGSGEQTTLESKSIDIIVCAQAFHWFCNEAAKNEFERILKPNGHIVLIWNDRDENDAFQADYEHIIQKYSTDYNEVAHKHITDAIIQSFFENRTIEKHSYTYSQSFDFEGLIGRITSSSYMPNKSDANFEAMKNEVRELYQRYEENNQIQFRYTSRVFIIGR